MEKTFEASLKELEEIVGRLEEGDLPLESSLELFEKGVKLSRECRARLDNAERRIELLTRDANGDLSVQPLDTSDVPRDGSNAKKRIVFDGDDN
jgi:exodeoxyribonuclease VII small subunit